MQHFVELRLPITRGGLEASPQSQWLREGLTDGGLEVVLLETRRVKPRHIEIHVFADQSGEWIHSFERGCSVQCRHQTTLGEAPAPRMTPRRREAMGEAAVKAAKAVGYLGAGTVEFIANQDGSFTLWK